MAFIRLIQVLLAAWLMSATIAENSPSTKSSGSYVTTDKIGQFSLDNHRYRFFATNVYWLPVLETEEDIDQTLASIAKLGIKVIRTWAFNDVDQIPEKGTWFQLISKDGSTQINDGPNGLQKLDLILSLAEKHGIHVIFVLTNNWNPRASGAKFKSPRNFLSNDYGGMDTYVSNIAHSNHHDDFYTDPAIVSAFSSYVSHVVQRYTDCPSLLAWELANDPRCYSTFSASHNCNTHTITSWHASIAHLIKSLDHNHMVSSGNHGFFCVGCPKLFPFQKRDSDLLLEARENTNGTVTTTDLSNFAAFNGFHGIDNADILNIPDIDFSTFQLFLEQNVYGPSHPDLAPFENGVQVGIDWIRLQAALANALCKPAITTAFGVLTYQNIPVFVPFNMSQPPYFDFIPPKIVKRVDPPPNYGKTNEQRNMEDSAWVTAGSAPVDPPGDPPALTSRDNNGSFKSRLQGMAFYLWDQEHLKPNDVIPSSGDSPNDGYSIGGVGKQDFINQVILPAVQKFSD